MATQWLCRFFLHTAKCKVLFDVVYALARLKWNTLHFRLSMLTLTFSVCLNVMLSVFRHLYYHHHQSKDIMPNKFLFHPLCRSSYSYIVFFRLFNEYFFHYVPNSFSMFHSLFLMHVLYPSLASKKKMKIEHTQTHTENSIHFIHFVLWIFLNILWSRMVFLFHILSRSLIVEKLFLHLLFLHIQQYVRFMCFVCLIIFWMFVFRNF